MSNSWQVFDLTSLKGSLSYNRNSRKLVVTRSDTGEVSEHAFTDINIVFIGIGVKLSAGIMTHFTNKDIVVVFCDWRGVPISAVYPWVDAHGRVAARQRAQAALSLPRSKNAWMRIVKSKVRGQAHNLDALGRDGGDYLRDLAAKVRSGDPSNIEAQAAKYYWSKLFDEPFSRRPGEGKDGWNSMLDYGYTILRGHSMRAVISAGLTPALGLFHKGRGNAFALADDLIEPFRPVIDYTVAQLPSTASVSEREIKEKLLLAANSVFLKDGLCTPAVMTDLAQAFGKYIEDEEPYLEVPEWS